VKLVMTLLVRNEADIVQANLDYHLAQGVDHVIVTDHGSTDETPRLLRDYERNGVATVIREEGDEHHQSVRVTRMARLALTAHCADWVFHNDADEFWWPLSGSLRDKVAHRPHPDVVVAPGNHLISGAELRRPAVTGLLEAFHFPMRDYDQFERKVVQVGLGYEKLDFRSPEVGADQLTLLDLYRRNELREYYESLRLDAPALQARLNDGTVLVDRRLEAFMAGRADHDVATRPDGPPTRAFVAESLQALAELHDAAAQLQHRRGELDAAVAELEGRRARAAHLQQELDLTRTTWGGLANAVGVVGGRRLAARIPRIRALWYRTKTLRRPN
jgi:hypothetical protein